MDIEEIQNRNENVEANKAWETSKTRRTLIALITYCIIGFYLNLLKVNYAWLHALVPTMGYVLSTLTLPLIKVMWRDRIYKKEQKNGAEKI